VKQGFSKLCIERFIVPIFKGGDKNNVSNYMTIMICHFLILYEIILETKISSKLRIERFIVPILKGGDKKLCN
jgi:hypothetical protein